MASVSGLVSGLDTDTIIQGLLKIKQQKIDGLTAQKQTITSKQTAFSQIQAQLVTLQSQSTLLGRSQNNVLDTRAVATSDQDSLTATATAKAAVGVFQVKINSLAQANQVASQGFANAGSEITQGTFTIRTGNGTEKTVTIDSTNNTLQGLADSINAAGAGVTASIVQDASSPAAPAKLLLSSQKTGTRNAIVVTNNLGASTGTATQPVIDFTNPVQAASDASVQLGSGAGAITATSDTNTVTGLISGVTLNLQQADATKTLTVTVSRDAKAAGDAVQKFVDAYNDLTDLFASQFKYDSTSSSAGTLLGNQSAQELQDSVRTAVLGVASGVNSKLNRLSALGITVGDDGKLAFDTTKLNSILAGQTDGVTGDDVRRLFALDGQSSNSGISFIIGSSKTNVPSSPVQIDITRAAEQAVVTGGSTVAASTVIDGTNDTLAIRIDGQAATITLDHGTYSQDQLAAQLQTAINSNKDLTGRSVTVAQGGGAISIRSASYGTSSEVGVTGGTALTALGFAGSESDFGENVAGSFIVNGVSETATGQGQLLSGISGNANTDGLQVRVSLSASQVQPGVDSNLTLTQGVAWSLGTVLNRILDPVTGRLKAVDDGFDQQADDIQKAIDKANDIFTKEQATLTDKFNTLESTLSQLQSLGSSISAQLGSLTSS
jgi:flagellar hook-associated protein 2